MSEQDELRDQAARIAYEIEVENYGGYDWDTAKNDAGKEVGPFEFAPPLYELDMAYEIADKIIALVRADERKRIREAIEEKFNPYEGLDEAVETYFGNYDDVAYAVAYNTGKSLDAALAAIGIDVEEDQP